MKPKSAVKKNLPALVAIADGDTDLLTGFDGIDGYAPPDLIIRAKRAGAVFKKLIWAPGIDLRDFPDLLEVEITAPPAGMRLPPTVVKAKIYNATEWGDDFFDNAVALRELYVDRCSHVPPLPRFLKTFHALFVSRPLPPLPDLTVLNIDSCDYHHPYPTTLVELVNTSDKVPIKYLQMMEDLEVLRIEDTDGVISVPKKMRILEIPGSKGLDVASVEQSKTLVKVDVHEYSGKYPPNIRVLQLTDANALRDGPMPEHLEELQVSSGTDLAAIKFPKTFRKLSIVDLDGPCVPDSIIDLMLQCLSLPSRFPCGLRRLHIFNCKDVPREDILEDLPIEDLTLDLVRERIAVPRTTRRFATSQSRLVLEKATSLTELSIEQPLETELVVPPTVTHMTLRANDLTKVELSPNTTYLEAAVSISDVETLVRRLSIDDISICPTKEERGSQSFSVDAIAELSRLRVLRII